VAAALGRHPDQVLDLSVNTNPFAPDVAPVVTAHLEAGALARYPDGADQRSATVAMAEALDVAPERVLLTNGGSEAIALVAGELRTGWVDEPDFSLYRRHLERLDPSGPRFRSDPTNPTGRLADADETAEVWDEAFVPLALGRWSRSLPGGPTPREAPAVVVGSVTKVLACPGLRLGYAVVPEDDGASLGHAPLLTRLVRRQPRWSVGTPALLALPELLAKAELGRWAAQVASARSDLVAVLEAHGLTPRPSDANFVLVDRAPGLREQLAERGVVVRDVTSFGLPGAVRIAVPDADGLARLCRALDEVAQ